MSEQRDAAVGATWSVRDALEASQEARRSARWTLVAFPLCIAGPPSVIFALLLGWVTGVTILGTLGVLLGVAYASWTWWLLSSPDRIQPSGEDKARLFLKLSEAERFMREADDDAFCWVAPLPSGVGPRQLDKMEKILRATLRRSETALEAKYGLRLDELPPRPRRGGERLRGRPARAASTA